MVRNSVLMITVALLFWEVFTVIPCEASVALFFVGDSVGCLPPLRNMDTFVVSGPFINMPSYFDFAASLSPDGKYLINGPDNNEATYVLNLKTLDNKRIKFYGGLQSESDGAASFQYWCPYDPDLFILIGYMVDDTSKDTTVHKWAYQGYMFSYRISTGESQILIPKIYDTKDSLPPLSSPGWTAGSGPGHDTIFTGVGFYNLQSGKFIYASRSPHSNQDTLLTSPDGLHHYWASDKIYLDTTQLSVINPSAGLLSPSFSPDSKLFGFSADPDTPQRSFNGFDTVLPEVYIYQVSNPSKPYKVINFQQSFCLYSFGGIFPKFITDSTLAVSMHHDGDSVSPLWEITLDGRIVRQLTFLPDSELGVVGGNVSSSSAILSIYPDPITTHTTISFTLPEAGAASLTVTDAAGRESPLLHYEWMDAGPHEITWDASEYPSGVYLCRLKTSEGIVDSKFVVQH